MCFFLEVLGIPFIHVELLQILGLNHPHNMLFSLSVLPSSLFGNRWVHYGTLPYSKIDEQLSGVPTVLVQLEKKRKSKEHGKVRTRFPDPVRAVIIWLHGSGYVSIIGWLPGRGSGSKIINYGFFSSNCETHKY